MPSFLLLLLSNWKLEIWMFQLLSNWECFSCKVHATPRAIVLCCVPSCLTLWEPMDCSSPSSSVCGILQVRILEWVAMSFFRGSSWPRDQTCISCIGRRFLYHWAMVSVTKSWIKRIRLHERGGEEENQCGKTSCFVAGKEGRQLSLPLDTCHWAKYKEWQLKSYKNGEEQTC